MKGMIFAAGLGTRLRPLTDTTPKALIEVEGTPLLEHIITKLRAFGLEGLIINIHHHAQQIIDFVRARGDFGMEIVFSHEPDLLSTGGGLKQAGWFLRDSDPFLLHNVDVLTDLPLADMLQQHRQRAPLASIAVRQRDTQRYFLFDESLQLCGWESLQSGEKRIAREGAGTLQRLSFMGIHIISPRIFSLFEESGRFSIVDAYLRLASAGESIIGYRDDHSRWLDLGRMENFHNARRILGDDFFDSSSHSVE